MSPRRLSAALALALATGALVSDHQARAQIDPQRWSYGLYLLEDGADPVLAGEVFREDLDPASYTEHWVLFANYVAPDERHAVQLVPSLHFYADTADFLARVPFPPGARYQEARIATYDAVPETRCVTVRRGDSGAVGDALVNSASPAKNYGTSGSLTASLVGSGSELALRHGLVRFDLRDIPETATVVSAELELHVLLYGGATVRVHRVTTPWKEPDVTWASFAGEDGGVVASLPPAVAGQAASAELTDLVQGWVNGGVDNLGLLLERDAGTTVFASSESPDPALRPALTVCYF